MIAIDLVTGFLGSGKTTFIKHYVQHLIDAGQRVAILENDFGAVNIDMVLLSQLEKAGCELEMVAGGCDKDCHLRRFKTKLISLGMRGFDRIVVEPSGIFDVDEFYDVLCDEPLDRWYEIGNVFAVVDAAIETSLSRASRYLLASQVAGAGRILLSKTKEASPGEIEKTKDFLAECLAEVHCTQKVQERIFAKSWEELEMQDYELLMASGYQKASFEKMWFDEKEAFQSVYLWHMKETVAQMQSILQQLFKQETCGHVIRVKGFVPKLDSPGYWMINATKDKMTIEEIESAQEVVIVIGEALQEENIRSICNSYELP